MSRFTDKFNEIAGAPSPRRKDEPPPVEALPKPVKPPEQLKSAAPIPPLRRRAVSNRASLFKRVGPLLSSMVSDVKAIIRRVEKETAQKASDTASETKTGATSQAGSSGWSKASHNARRYVGATLGKSITSWVFAIGALLGVLWLVGNSGWHNDGAQFRATERPSSESGDSVSKWPYVPPPSQPTNMGSVTELEEPARIRPQAPRRLSEVKPPEGTNNILTQAQIRYCLAEQIRIDAAETVVSPYSDSNVDRFNAMVGDYNRRCGEYRYRGTTLATARAEVEPSRALLQSEGRGRFVQNKRSTGGQPRTASVPRTNTSVRNSSTSGCAGGSTIYRYVDGDGFIHYTKCP